MKSTELVKLPTLNELVNESEDSIKENQLMVLLNQNPPQKWVKKHPFINNHYYMPIGVYEYLLRRIFTDFSIEVLKTGILFNAIEVSIRLTITNPVTGKIKTLDGVGACELQTVKGSGNLKPDMSNVNKGAVQMALPIAKSAAIKDACDHLGKIFGSDLNRKENIDYNSILKTDKKNTEPLKNQYDD